MRKLFSSNRIGSNLQFLIASERKRKRQVFGAQNKELFLKISRRRRNGDDSKV